MKGAKIVSRFGLYSKTEPKESFIKLIDLMPEGYSQVLFMGERRALTNEKLATNLNKMSSIIYKNEFENIFDLNDCNDAFIYRWKDHEKCLKTIFIDHDISLVLDYEVTVFDFHFPAFCFDKVFIDFLARNNIELKFCFYEE